MPVPPAVNDLETWVRSLPATSDKTTPAYLAAIGVLVKHGRTQLPADPDWRKRVTSACAIVAERLRTTSGADLGHFACVAQGLVFLIHADQIAVPEELLQAFDDADFDASSTVVIERWTDAYGVAGEDFELLPSIAVPLPSSLAALVTGQDRQSVPTLSFSLRPAIGGEGVRGEITESVFANAAASDGDAPESLRRQVFAEPQARDGIPGLTVGRELLPDWTLVVDLRIEPAPVSIHLRGLPLIYDSLFDGWTTNLRPLPRSERLRLLNAPLAIRFATGDRIHIAFHSSSR